MDCLCGCSAVVLYKWLGFGFELGRFFGSVDWAVMIFQSLSNCDFIPVM